MAEIKDQLISAGVGNLRDFGYPECDKENILTDLIYSAFFKSMLEENKGMGVDVEIDELLATIKETKHE